MLTFLPRYILLSIFFDFSVYSVENALNILKFTHEWELFIKSKEVKESQIGTEAYQEYEFSLLDEFSDQQAIRYRPYLQMSDRYEDCRPYSENRITLLDGTEMSASFIQLTNLKKDYQSFIAAQAPSKHNIHLFWQMILENQINQIVMVSELSESEESVRELVHPYWPQKLGEKLILENGLEITCIEEKELLPELQEKIDIRTMHLHSKGKDRLITHYWYRNWIDNTAPAQSQTILTLIDTIEEDKRSLESLAPILVHCSAGIGRTGVFLTLYYLKQRIKDEDQKINLFNFIAYLRWQRPFLVTVLPQYKFCYKIYELLQQLKE